MSLEALVESWKMWDAQEKQARAEKERIAAEIIATGENPEPYGVRKVTKFNGYSNEIIPLLKERGFRQAIKIIEKPITTEIRNLIKRGELFEGDIKRFEKPQSVFLTLTKREEY